MTAAYPGRDRPALPELSLAIRPGERVAVTGPSGAGKSTLLALLLGFVQPAAGTIQVGGADLAAIDAGPVARPDRLGAAAAAPVRRHRGRQHRAGQPRRPPGPRSGGRPSWPVPPSSSRRCPAATTRELGERGLRLSAGERQKIALARAFLRDARLLLLDEPAAHLDPASARQLWETVETMAAGRTVVLVSHGRGWEGLASRVITLDHGQLRQPNDAARPPTTAVLRPQPMPTERGPVSWPAGRRPGAAAGRCCGCCGWPGRCAPSCSSRCLRARPLSAAAWRCWPPAGSCSPARPSTRASSRSRSPWSRYAGCRSGVPYRAMSNGWPPTTSRSGSSPTSGWRSTGASRDLPRRAWPRSGPATCWPA